MPMLRMTESMAKPLSAASFSHEAMTHPANPSGMQTTQYSFAVWVAIGKVAPVGLFGFFDALL